MPAEGSAGHAVAPPPFKPLPQKGPDIHVERRADGVITIRSNHPLGARPRTIAHLLDERAAQFPDRAFIKQRLPDHGPWRSLTYGQAKQITDSLAQAFLDMGLGPDAPVMILSGNSIEHAMVTLAAMKAGAPAAPISAPYSTMSSDFAKVKHCFAAISPKAIFVQTVAPFAKALAALPLDGVTVIALDGAAHGFIDYAALVATPPTPSVAGAMERLTDASVAKFLFTSGSTGMPKPAPQTQGAMCSLIAAQDGLRDEPMDFDDPPQALDWMPWNHISGANVNFNANMWAGGTLHLDEGKPIPGLFETTIKNLYEVSPRVFGSAPIAFSMLADAMERDEQLMHAFFKNLRYMGYGGATLSDDLYDRLQALAIKATGQRVPLTTMYGATETQGITVVHWLAERVGLIGLPLPGLTLKLVPNGSKYEVRVKGPTVMAGYHNDPKRNAEAFDEEGFYKLGDAAKFVDPDDPAQGLVFDGRVTEDFKLSSGTWVSVGTLRPDLVAACSPLIHDAVIVGQDKPYVSVLMWPSPAALAKLTNQFNGDAAKAFGALAHQAAERLAAFNATAGGSSRRVARALMMSEPPSIDAGEITDKGYVNQRLTLERRANLVAALYQDPAPAGVMVLE